MPRNYLWLCDLCHGYGWWFAGTGIPQNAGDSDSRAGKTDVSRRRVQIPPINSPNGAACELSSTAARRKTFVLHGLLGPLRPIAALFHDGQLLSSTAVLLNFAEAVEQYGDSL